MKKVTLLIGFLALSLYTLGSNLEPGFKKAEYLDVLKITAHQLDAKVWDTMKIDMPKAYGFHYRSATMGLDNRYDIWLNEEDKIAALNIRGTTLHNESWLANFYAAMVPAKGTLNIEKDFVFNYSLAEDHKAAVHVGWLVSTAYLSRDITIKLDSLYKEGYKDFMIMGHSQGGAISYLLTSHLLSLKKQGEIPADVTFKTYCSAAPKPGNLYYAYEYEAATFGGWAFNVVNAADWVPETPISIQTLDDFNNTNPFKNAEQAIKQTKFPKRIALKKAYKDLSKPAKKAQRKYQKYLGKLVSTSVKSYLEEYEEPTYYNSNHYVRTGVIIVLMPDEEYNQLFPDSDEKLFVHHLMEAYMHLALKLPD